MEENNSDDEISLAELARAYRKRLNRSTHRYTRPSRVKPTGSGSESDSVGSYSTGSDTAHESDADWDIEDSETEKESEGEGRWLHATVHLDE